VEALEAAAAVDDAELRVQLAAVDSLPPGDLTPLLKAQQARFRARLEPDDADTLYNDAEQLLRELGVPFHLAVVRLEHAERLAAEGQAEPAEPLLADARETFDRLRAKPWLDRVAAASASFVTVA